MSNSEELDWKCRKRFTRSLTYEMRLQHDEFGTCKELLDPKHKKMIETGQIVRVSGEGECSVCGRIWYDHPIVVGALWLHEGCTLPYLLKL